MLGISESEEALYAWAATVRHSPENSQVFTVVNDDISTFGRDYRYLPQGDRARLATLLYLVEEAADDTKLREGEASEEGGVVRSQMCSMAAEEPVMARRPSSVMHTAVNPSSPLLRSNWC